MRRVEDDHSASDALFRVFVAVTARTRARRISTFIASMAIGFFVASVCTHCSSGFAPPVLPLPLGDAQDLCAVACNQQATYCPSSMTDAGVSACEAWCRTSASGHKSMNTEPQALQCVAAATDKVSFLACGTMSLGSCP